MDNKGTNPLADARLFIKYCQILSREGPDVFLGYTIKPNVYGSLAAHACGIPVINNVSGLGTAFIRETWLTNIAKSLYRAAFRRSHTVFFQNNDDRQYFLAHKLVRAEQAWLLPGSGVDLERFKPVEQHNQTSRPGVRFLLIARLLYDKGVREYVEASRLVRSVRPDATCALLGFLDAENRTAVSRDDVMDGCARVPSITWARPMTSAPILRRLIALCSHPTVKVRREPCSKPQRWENPSSQPTYRGVERSLITRGLAFFAPRGMLRTLLRRC